MWIALEYCGGGSVQDVYHGMFAISIVVCSCKIKNCFSYPTLCLPSLIYLLNVLMLLSPCFLATGPLDEKLIAYVCRETLQV